MCSLAAKRNNYLEGDVIYAANRAVRRKKKVMSTGWHAATSSSPAHANQGPLIRLQDECCPEACVLFRFGVKEK